MVPPALTGGPHPRQLPRVASRRGSDRRPLALGVMLALFNPAASLSQWMLASWGARVVWCVAVVAMVLLHMLSLAREFLGATIVA